MSKKEELAKKYADWLHKNVEEYFGQKCDPKDIYYRNGDIMGAFEAGWDSAVAYAKKLSPDELEKFFNEEIH